VAFVFVCRFVCFVTQYLKTNGANITKLHTEMFHHESRKPVYVGVRGSKVKVMRHKKHYRRGSWHSGECWLVVVSVCDLCVCVCVTDPTR